MSACRHRPRGRLPRSVAAFARGAAAGLLLAVFALLAASMPAEAQTSVPANWSLKPSGLVTGNQFRLLFVTSTTRDATSSAIGDYDTHVRNAAAAGHADIESYSSQFTVVGSTSAVDARDNTRTTGTGVPIYWLNGSKVADNYPDFYDGSWDNPNPGNDESGASHDFTSTDEIFTGSQSGGTNAGSASLGGTTHSRVGQPGAGTPINDGSSSAEKTLSRAFYGISPVFEVAASTDATLSALSLSGVTLSPGFAAAVDTYTASVANSVSSTTVSATANDANATVSSITPEDADSSTAGHQVDLDVGDTAVTVTVTAEDGTAKTYTVTVNREALPVITIASDQETYLEGSTLGFTLSRTGTADTQLSVPLQLSQTGHHRVSTRNPMVNFTAGETTARLETLFVEDADPEETGTYTLTIRESTDYERGDPYSVTVTKQDDGDPFVEVFVRSQSQFIAEAPDAEATATVQMATTDASDRAPERIRVALASHGITAEGGHGKDYEEVAETLIFDTSDYNVQTNGRWLAVKSFPVEIYDDDELEADETFLLRLERHPSTPGHIRMCTPSIDPDSAECRAQITTITIVDNEVTITADANEKADLQLVEGGAPLEISFTLIVDQTGLLPKPSSINLELEGVSAIHDDDFSFESDSESQLQLRFDLRDYRTVLIDGIQRYASTKSVMVRASDDEDVEGAETFNINITKGSFGTLRPERLNLLTEILSVTIVDQDVPTVSISDASASEGAPSVDFTVELDQAGPDEVTVEWATSDGAGASGATAPADYVAASGTLTFAPGDVTKTIAVAIASDTLDEADETFTVTLSGAVNAEIGDAGATGTIEDDDAVEVSLSPASPSVDEGVGNLEFEAALNLESTRTVTVDWALADGTAVAGEDYTAASGTLTFAPGDTAKTITVAVRDDALDEDDETFEVALSGETNAAVSERRALVTIQDNDGMPSLEIADADTDEGENQTFAVTLSPVSGRAVTVEWATADGTAASRADYDTATGTLTFPAGQTSQTITVETEEDALDEDDETFTVTLSSAVNAAIGDAGATGTIRDDDPEPSLSIGDGSASEGAASMTFEVTLSEVSGREVTVDWATEDGTAVSGADYDTATGTLTFPAGQTSQTITVTVRDDTLDEDDETFTVTLSGAVNAAIGDAGATGTIEDDDAVEVSLSPASPSVDEGVGNLEFEAALNLESTRTVTVDWALADGTAVAGEDYTAASGTLTFVPGDTVKTITVAVRDDALDEDDETFEVTLSGETNAAVSERRASVTIRDNDGMPSLEIADTDTDEGENQTFAVTLSPVSGRAVTVEWATADGTAVSGADYDTATGTLTFPAGQTSRTITVETKEDALDEDDETFTVTLSSAVNAAIGDDDATGTIRDDDPEPSLLIGDGSASEGAASMNFEVTLSEVSGREVTVDWATSDGAGASGATAPADYDTATGTLTFPAGQTSQTITVTVRDDTLDEADETFTVTLSSAVNAEIGDAGATGTIEDDDAVEVSLSPASPSVDEGVGNLEFEAALNLESTKTVTVDWALADGTAVAGEDYTAESGTLTFAPGDTAKTITVAVRDDALDEDDETFEVALSGETNAAVSVRRALVTIQDNDGMPSLEIADTETDEGENQTFAVTLSPVSGRAVTVEWATADGTAASGADYDTATGTLTFPAGQTSRTITVETKEDALDEADETFTVTLSSAVNAAIGDDDATGTIRDDDPEPSLSIGDGSASEGAASVTFEVTLSEVSGREVTVDWATSDGAGASGATAPADYVTASGTLTFAPDEVAKTIAVVIASDTLDEADETFTVTLSGAVNAAIDDAGATGTIEDDDAVDWSLTAAPNAIAEAGTESSTVTVSTGGVTFPNDRTITLGLAGTATKVMDYTVGSETLTLTAGQGEVSTTITAVNDTEDDDAETIIVTAMLDGATIGTQPTITITDDDTPANNAPVITTTSPIPVAENTTAVATLTATDADTGDTLTWSKNGGDDAAKFDLTGSGVLTFANAPDFENPADTGADNGYEVTVRVSDGTATADLALIVNVTDAVETATLAITGLANATVAENTAWTSPAPTLTGTPVGAVTWTLEGTDAGDFTIDPGTGEVSMVARDYENPADADTDNAYEVTVKATDADANTATMDITVTVTDAVETATLAITGLANATVAENTAWTSPAPTLTGTPVGAVTWTLEGTDAGDFTINPGTGVVSMVARDYENPEDADTDNVYEVTVKATDADANTAAVAITVTVTDVVETATLAIGGLANATVAENTAWTSPAPTLTGTPVGAVTWTLEGTDAGDFTIDPGTGEVSMVARDYENPADADTDNAYEVTVKATDADANTATMDITVTVTDAVETATLAITGLANATVAENTAWTSPAPTLTGTPVGAVTWTLEGTDAGDFTIDPGTGEVSMVARDYENPEDADTDNAYEVTVKATDADANTAAVAITVTVTDVVETATLAIGGLANATVAENTAWTSSAPTLTGSPVGAVTWTLEGTDAGDFTIDPGTGEVSMVARDYENPADADTDNAYEVTVKATDADANTATMDITVTVTDAVETATLAITGLANATVAENTAWTSPAPTLTGTPVGAVTWTLEGTDAGDFTIDPGTGEVSMVARDYENPEDADTDNAYEVTVKATDADANTAAVAITVTVTDVVETATLAIGGLANATVAENTAWTSPAPTLTGTPVGAVTWTLEGTDAGDFTIDPGTGEVSMVARDYENPEDADTDNAYEVTVKATDADANTAAVAITVTVADVLEPPDAPAAPSVSSVSGSTTSLDVRWSAPGTNGRPPLTGYELRYREGTTGNWTSWAHSGTGTSATITSLSASTSYQVQVRALNGEKPGDWSPSGTGSTGIATAAAVTLVLTPPSIAEDARISTVTATVSPASTTAFTVAVSALAVSPALAADFSLSANTTLSFAANAPQSTGLVTITAVDDTVDAPAKTVTVSGTVTGGTNVTAPSDVTLTITDDDAAISTPGAPTNLEATADGTDTIDLEWKAPTETGGAAITGYRIEWSADGSTNWADRVADTGSTATRYPDNPLDPGTMRHYRVSAINSEGTGDPSGVADATTDVPVTVTVPATKSVAEDGAVMTVDIRATTGVDAQPPRPFEIQLVTADGTAVSPGDYGAVDATITFDVANFSREDIGGGVQRWVALKTPPISIVDDSATEDDETFTVTLSRPADLSSAITLGSRKETTVTILDDDGAVPGAPTQLSATADGTDTIDLTWMAPGSTGGKPITGYRIEFSDDAGTAWTALVADTGTTGTSHSDTTVARNSTRHYRVSAINRIGTGPASISAHATTADRDPPYPTITYEGPATGGFEVKVTWSEAVTGFEGIDPDACCLGDLHAGYDGGPDVLIRSLTEATTGLEYTAVVPIAPPSGKPRLTVYILDGAATGVVGGLENVYGYLHFAVDADGYPTEVRAPVAQRVEIVPPGGRSNRNAFSTRNNDVDVVWATGDAVEVRVTFSEPVTVDLTDGTPMLGLVVAGQARSARYSHGSGTEALTFSYRVTPGDGTVTAVSVTANSLALDGATLRNDAGVDADLTHPGASIGGAPAEPALTVADAEAASGELSFRVTLSRAASAPVTVDWATADGTATAGDDYEASSGTLTFVAGETEKTVAVAVLADGVAEAEEALTLTLSNPTGAALEDAQATGTIADAGEPPNSGPGLTASIAAASQSALASVVHTGAADAPQLVVRFDAAVATLAATTPSLRLEGASVRSVSRLDTAGREWLFLLRPDGDGGILARLEAGRPCDRGGICTASGSVLSEVPSRAHAIPGPDGPVPGVALVGISVASSPADGTAYAAGERIEATASFAAPVEVDTGGGTPRVVLVVGGATRMAAWTAGSGTASLVFAYTVTAADTGDGDVPVGGVRVGAGGLDLNGGVIRAAATPPNAEPALTVADAEAASGTLSFRVTLAPAATAPVTVDWATSDETATAGADYTSASGTLAFAPGETGKTVTVAVLADGVAESEETLTLALANPSGAALEDAQATGTIADAGEPAPAAVPLTASFTDAPPAHAGSGTFTFRILFSEPVGIGYKTLRDESFATTGGAVTGARRVDGRSDLWEIEVEPAGDSDVAVTLAGGRACDEGGAVCTRDGRRLSGTVSLTVPGPGSGTPEAPLTASFTDAPREHDGAAAFTFRILFSEPVGIGHKTLRDESLAAVGGTVRRAKRVDGRSDLWEIEVEPDGLAGVVVTLAGGRACATAGAVCTKNGKPLSATVSLTVRGPAALSVADARAKEGTDATIDFAVTLDRAASGTVTVDYATSDGTAVAGADYTRAVGTLTFAAGETAKTVAVAVLDDARDEGEERFTLTLSNASGAYIADGEAAGIIENDDPMPAAWLARFGRTVGTQVVDAVTARLEGGGGSHVTVGGQNLAAGGAAPDDLERREAEARLEAMSDWLRGETAGDGAQRSGSRTMTERELLLGSSFHLASENEDRGLSFAAWGRMAMGRFDADVDEVRLDGDVTTAILGADVESGRWLAGAALSHSRGTGGYALGSGVESVFGEGEVESTLTSVTPYARLELSERVSAWGLVGYGTGELTLTEGSGEETNRYTADIALRMGAAGARGTLLAPEEAGGFELAVKSDAMWVRMTSEKVEGMEGSETDTSRVRLILDGSRSFEMGGGTLTPSLELGLRHDGGDAETGTGVEVGAGIRYAQGGVTVEGAVRTLVAHEEAGYEEWGASGSVRIDPGASGRGLAFSVAPTWGNASSGTASLWSAHDASALAPDGEFEAGRRLEVEAGYGLGVPRALGTVTPYLGLSLADGSERSWRAGARWQVAPGFSVSLEGTRREAANDDAPEHGLTLRGALRW